MAPEQLAALIERGAAPVILDTRSRWEYRGGHIPDACHVPFWQVLGARLPPPGASDVVVYCAHGPRAWVAVAALRVRGIRAGLLAGHLRRWRRRGLPVER